MTKQDQAFWNRIIDGGVVQTGMTASGIATYSGSTAAFLPPATPTDMWVMEGSATKVVRILRIELSGTQTTLGINRFNLIRHSTANAGGTSAAMTLTKLDTLSATATATAKSYTANPTPGTSAGNVSSVLVLTPDPAAAFNPVYVWDFTGINHQPIVLRGVAQGVAINFGGAALPAGLSLSVNVLFTESDN